jgi:hypothetical protein
MNDYDKAGRYLVKREPAGFFRWFLANSAVSFEAWTDARRIALPDQNDLTNDLVAVLRSGGSCFARSVICHAGRVPPNMGPRFTRVEYESVTVFGRNSG